MTTTATQTHLPPSLTNDTPINPELLELSPAEQAALDAAKPVDTTAADAAKQAADDAAAAKAAEDQAAADAAATAQAAKTDEVDVSVDLDLGVMADPVIPVIAPKEAPKFEELQTQIDTARAALDKAYDENEIDAAEFRKRDRELSRKETALATQKATYEAQLATQQALIEAETKRAETAWKAAYTDFFNQPENAPLFKSQLNYGAFQACITAVENHRAAKKLAPLPNEALLSEARKVYVREMGIKEETQQVTPPPPPARKADTAVVPKTVAAAPAAAPAVNNSSDVDTMYTTDISELEDLLARMKPHEVDAVLRKLPGATVTGTVD